MSHDTPGQAPEPAGARTATAASATERAERPAGADGARMTGAEERHRSGPGAEAHRRTSRQRTFLFTVATLAAVFVLAVPATHGTAVAQFAGMVAGALFGMSAVLLFFAVVGILSRRMRPAAGGYWALGLVVYLAASLGVNALAPASVPAGLVAALLVFAAVLWAGHRAFRADNAQLVGPPDAPAAYRTEDDDEEVAQDADPDDAPAAYRPEDALSDVGASRSALADRLITPIWYHPLIALAVAGLILALGLNMPSGWMLAIEVPAILLIGATVVAYRKLTGVWVSTAPRGTRAFRVHLALGVVTFAGVLLALLARYAELPALAIACTVVVFVGYIVLGRLLDATLRAELRGGVR